MDGDRHESPHPRGGKENPAKNKVNMTRNNMGNSHTSTRTNPRANQAERATHQEQQRQKHARPPQPQSPPHHEIQQQQPEEEAGHGDGANVLMYDRISPSSSPGTSSLHEAHSSPSLSSAFAVSSSQLSLSAGTPKRDSLTSTRSLPGIATNLAACSVPAVVARADGTCSISCQGISANACKSANCGAAAGSNLDDNLEWVEPSEHISVKGDEGGVNAIAAGPLPQNVANAAPFNWQSQKTTVKERLAFLFNTDTMADVNFLIGKEPFTQLVPAHKFVLSMSSAVFDALFNGGMATTESVIEIPM